MAEVPAEWRGILDPGETILWQGAPDGGLIFSRKDIQRAIFGGVFFAFSAFITLRMIRDGAFWPFGLLFMGAGVHLMAGPQLLSAWRRRHTFYTLTDRRAFIATSSRFSGRELLSYPIDPNTPLDYRADPPASIYFATGHRGERHGARRIPIGFERISDGDKVYRLFRQAQARARQAPPPPPQSQSQSQSQSL